LTFIGAIGGLIDAIAVLEVVQPVAGVDVVHSGSKGPLAVSVPV
jgi:hypothetical protein